MGPFLPKNSKRPRPTTVGGRTKGKINNPSTTFLNFPEYLAIQRAATIPRKNVITVAVKTVLNEIHNGDKYVSAMGLTPFQNKGPQLL